MKTLKYLFYDNANDINNKELKINIFKYNDETIVKDLYMELRNKFYSDYGCEVDYVIVDNICNYQIKFDNFEKPLKSVLEHCHLDNIIIVYSVLPIGGTGAIYNSYRIYIHSNELIHKHLPHVHVEYGGFNETRINLETLEIMDDDIFCSRKDKKKIIGYLKENQDRWIGYFNSIIEGKDPGMKIEKII